MSFDHTRAAWLFCGARPDMSANAAFLLLALANRHNPKTGQCNPSIQTLAKDCHTSERSIKRGIQELEAVLAIRVKRSNGGDQRNSNQYELIIHNGTHGAPRADCTPSTVSPEGVQIDTERGANWPLKQSEPVDEPAPSGVVDIRSRRKHATPGLIVPGLSPDDLAAGRSFFDAMKEKNA